MEGLALWLATCLMASFVVVPQGSLGRDARAAVDKSSVGEGSSVCTLPQDPAASALTPRTVSQAAPVTHASMEEPVILSVSLLIIPAAALHHSGAATVSSTQPPPAPLLLPV